MKQSLCAPCVYFQISVRFKFVGFKPNPRNMMTSSNGNIFRVNGHLWGKNTWSPVNSPPKGQWRGALIFSLISVWINGWVNNHEAGDLRLYRAHYDVIVSARRNISTSARELARRYHTRLQWLQYFQITFTPWSVQRTTDFDRCDMIMIGRNNSPKGF